MRAVFTIVVIGALLGAGWLWFARDRTAEIAADEARVARQKANLGMREMLRNHAVFDFKNIVIGDTGEDGLVDFRGQIDRSNRMTPAFGQIRRICEDATETPECWELALLEADGQLVDLGPATETEVEQTGTETEATGTETETTAGTTGEQGSEAETTGQPTVAATTEGTETETAASSQTTTTGSETPEQTQPTTTETATETVTGPPATHRVARALINARSGPGTGNPVVTRLSQGSGLAILETQDGWGRFIVLDGDARGTEVWVALSILEAL